jgi:hypothetical protein
MLMVDPHLTSLEHLVSNQAVFFLLTDLLLVRTRGRACSSINPHFRVAFGSNSVGSNSDSLLEFLAPCFLVQRHLSVRVLSMHSSVRSISLVEQLVQSLLSLIETWVVRLELQNMLLLTLHNLILGRLALLLLFDTPVHDWNRLDDVVLLVLDYNMGS